jgi:hypothetical protein
MVDSNANNLTFKDIKVNNNVSLGKLKLKQMDFLSPKEVLDKYPALGADWDENDLIHFHSKGLFLAKPNEDHSSILIAESSIVELIKVRERVLNAKINILDKNIKKAKRIPKSQ